MHEEFWQRRWARSEIAFHQTAINPYLERYFPQLNPHASKGRVLVPLCGKTLDILWLAGQGFSVLGIELSETAVQAFFAEQSLNATISQHGVFTCYQLDAIALWCGDFFALTAEDVADCSLLYDRAALIALPPEMRQAYAEHLSRILPVPCQGLLISLDYPQAQMNGPPFAVPADEVQHLLAADWDIRLLESPDVLADYPRFQGHGLSVLNEPVYQLNKKGHP